MHLGDEQIACSTPIDFRLFFEIVRQIAAFHFLFSSFFFLLNYWDFFCHLSIPLNYCFVRGIMMIITCSEFWLIEFYNLLLILNAPVLGFRTLKVSKSWFYSSYQMKNMLVENLICTYLYYYSTEMSFLSSLWFKGWLISSNNGLSTCSWDYFKKKGTIFLKFKAAGKLR